MGVLRREADGLEQTLGAEHQVGRSSSCALRLDPDYVSNNHAVIRWMGDAWSVSDLGSRNGTFLDGAQIMPAQRLPLALHARLGFGDAEDTWVMVDTSGPAVMAVPLDGGPACLLRDGVLVLPSPDAPSASIFVRNTTWILELNGAETELRHGDIVNADGRRYRFECAQAVVATSARAASERDKQVTKLRFRVSADEEYVELSVLRDATWCSLGSRTCYYLGLTLARTRLQHQREGLSEHGWIDVDILLKMLPDYANPQHLNVDIHRLRTQLARHGVEDAASIVERRIGQVRLGTSAVVIDVIRD